MVAGLLQLRKFTNGQVVLLRMQKRLAVFFTVLLFMLQSFAAFAENTAGRDDIVTPSPAPNQQVFDAAPTIPQAAGHSENSVLGTVLWTAVLLLLGFGLAYLVLNAIRRHKQVLAQSSLVRPKLIISEHGKKLNKDFDKPE